MFVLRHQAHFEKSYPFKNYELNIWFIGLTPIAAYIILDFGIDEREFFYSEGNKINMNPAQKIITLNYVEFKVGDIKRSKDFYGLAMGWTFTDYGENYCEFSDGQMKGGFELVKSGTSPGNETSSGPLVVLYCPDLTDAQNRIELAGGNIVKPVFEFPGGRRFHFCDPDGYELAVWSDN